MEVCEPFLSFIVVSGENYADTLRLVIKVTQ